MSLLDILIFLPILAAAGMAFGAPPRITALGVSLANLVITVVLLVGFKGDQAGWQFAASRQVMANPEINYAVGVDGMSLVLVLLTTLVTFCAVWLKSPEGANQRLYFASLLLISAGALGAFVCTDVFFLYAFHELALIPTFLMIGLYGSGGRERRLDAAWKITIYLGLGSMVLLAGLLWLVIARSPEGAMTFDLAKLLASNREIAAGTQAGIFCTLLIGFGILISLFPFHSWAAPAYAAAPTPVAMLHAGVLKKFGLYGLLRIALPLLPLGAQTEWVHHLLLWLLLGNIIIIGLVTIAQKELDLVLGNSSVMHMGYIFLGIASGSVIGYTGAVLLMFAHGVSIALLFALARQVREHSGTMELSRMGQLAKTAPFLGLTFGMAAMASIGLPGFANFASEIMVFFAAFKNWNGTMQPLQWATVFALWGVVISAVYMLRAYRKIFKGTGPSTLTYKSVPDTLADRVPVFILLAALLVVGFVPNLLINLVQPVLARIAGAN